MEKWSTILAAEQGFEANEITALPPQIAGSSLPMRNTFICGNLTNGSIDRTKLLPPVHAPHEREMEPSHLQVVAAPGTVLQVSV